MRKISYQYNLPQDLLAREPIVPRDHAKLFVYDTHSDKITFDRFIHLHSYIPPHAIIVLNQTKVVPSRITLYKRSGGKIVCLLLLNEPPQNGAIRVLVDRKVAIGEVMFLRKDNKTPIFTVVAHAEKSIFLVELLVTQNQLARYLAAKGVMPIPPYLKDTTLSRTELQTKYQTTFAQGTSPLRSVAAPTASLHFTPRVFRSLENINIRQAKISLEVGLGTFAPPTLEQIHKGVLHTEWYCIPPPTQRMLKVATETHQHIVAVGTTSVRALESYYLSSKDNCNNTPYLDTSLFIKPGFAFHYVDSLITNFHLPESSLMMLVEALLQYKKSKRSLLELYQIAIKERFKFFSFGDAMLIL